MDLASRLTTLLHVAPTRIAPLAGGSVGEVYRAWLSDGDSIVVKVAGGDSATLDCEGAMLSYLANHVPVPRVRHSSPDLLVMEFIAGDSTFPRSAERHAAELLAALHDVRADGFGFEYDTLIGGLHQPNPWTASWIDFFRDHRLVAMGRAAHAAGRLPSPVLSRLERFAERLPDLIDEPAHPALLHGDVWTTNVLARSGRIAAFLDPAIYFGHPEIELAFITLFDTFGPAFFDRYAELHPIGPGFIEERRDVYNLYPLLVHARLFGGGYVASVDRVLRHYGT